MSCKNRAKYRRWTRLDSLSSLLLPGNRSPESHDRGRKTSPTTAPSTGLVCAYAGGSALPRRGPCMVPRCHLERVRNHTHLPPGPSPSFLVCPHPGQIFYRILDSAWLGEKSSEVLGRWGLGCGMWARYFPSLNFSFLCTGGHQISTARDPSPEARHPPSIMAGCSL